MPCFPTLHCIAGPAMHCNVGKLKFRLPLLIHIRSCPNTYIYKVVQTADEERNALQCGKTQPLLIARSCTQCFIAIWENSTGLIAYNVERTHAKLYTMLVKNSMYCNVGKLKWPLTSNCTCTHGPSTYTYKVLHIAMKSSIYCNVGKLKGLPS